MRRARIGAAAAVCAGLLLAEPGHACSVSSAGVSFGVYDPKSSAATDGVGTISISCSRMTKTVVSIDTGSSGTFTARTMDNGGSSLSYNLYTSSTRSTVWGDGTSGTATVALHGTTMSASVYGRIPAGQDVRAGSFADAPLVTVTF